MFVFVGTLNELVVVVVGGPLVVDAGTDQTNSVQANFVIISLAIGSPFKPVENYHYSGET